LKIFKFLLAILASIAVAGCGGGGGGGGTTPPPSAVKINGMAASGAPIAGSVVAKDSLGATFGPATIAADGSYSLTVTSGTAPFILQATGSVGGTAVEVYSTAPDTTAANVNITPLTNVMVAQATGASPAALYSSCSSSSTCAAPSKAKVDLAVKQVQALLQTLLTQFGITGTVNVLTDAIVAGPVTGQSKIDIMLDAVSILPASAVPASFVVTPNPVTGLPATTTLIAIPAAPSGGVSTVATTALTVNPSLTPTVVITATTSLASLPAIQLQFDALSSLYATAQPAANNTTLLALFDTAWLDWGVNKTTFISNITSATFGPPAGTKWGNVVAAAPRSSSAINNDATHQWLKVTMKFSNGYTEVDGPILATNIGGTWVFSGNKLPAPALTAAIYNFSNTKTVNYNTVSDTATLTAGSLSLTKTITGGLTYSATGLTITVSNPRNATFTGSMTLSNGVTSALTTVNGKLNVREDESVVMQWTAANTLGGSQIYGCSTTNGIGCKPVNEGIVGTWKMSQYADGTPTSIQMVLLDDNRFMFLSTNTGGCQQMESGRYTYSSNTSLLALTVEYDTNPGCGVLQSGSPTVAAPVTIYRTFTPAGVLSSVAGGVTGSFTKQAQTTTTVGTWLFSANPGTDFALVINYADGTFVYAEAPSPLFPNPVANGRGMEYGTYTTAANSYTFATVSYDGNGTNSGINAMAGTALTVNSTDVNHVAIVTPDLVSHPMSKQ
jgi:hypothetical protein